MKLYLIIYSVCLMKTNWRYHVTLVWTYIFWNSRYVFLQLLMCGMGRVSFEDLKEHTMVSGTSIWFQQILSWFWTIVSSFTQEEMAKLLQFVTGCSQLPPGGFKELNPPFTVTSSPTRGRLPTAHTWYVMVGVLYIPIIFIPFFFPLTVLTNFACQSIHHVNSFRHL